MDFRLTSEQEIMVETATKIGEQFGLEPFGRLDLR